MSVCSGSVGWYRKSKGFLLEDALIGFCIISVITGIAWSIIEKRIQSDDLIGNSIVQLEESMEAVISECEKEEVSPAISSVNLP